MQSYRGRIFLIFVAFGSLFLGLTGAQAADPEIDRLLRGPIGKDWVTNGGNLTNQRRAPTACPARGQRYPKTPSYDNC